MLRIPSLALHGSPCDSGEKLKPAFPRKQGRSDAYLETTGTSEDFTTLFTLVMNPKPMMTKIGSVVESQQTSCAPAVQGGVFTMLVDCRG
jgi:hypothetical protein